MIELLKELKFDAVGLVPVVVQDHATGEVLMLAYMNKEAFEKTSETGMMHYWSRSRKRLWLKGETSGHFQHVKSMSLDCDGDALLAKVDQTAVACHTGNYSCFYRESAAETQKGAADLPACAANCPEDKASILMELYGVIADRKLHPKEGSYTNYLFEKGLDKILKKVGEETAEVIIAAKNRSGEEVRYETADLIYHLCVLLVECGIKLDDIYDELKSRR